MKGVEFVLNTRGRVDKQYTLKNLTHGVRGLISVVCYPGEKEQLQEEWGDKVKQIIEHPDHFENLSQIRQWCLDYFDSDYIFFLDDNLNFHARVKPEYGEPLKTKLCGLIEYRLSKETINRIFVENFNELSKLLKTDKYGIVGVSQRGGNQNVEEDYAINSRVFAFWGINKKLLNEANETSPKRFISDVKLKQDFYINLHLLTKGFPNIILYKLSFGKQGGVNAKGGCSIYRNLDESNKAAHTLHSHYPDFIKVRERSVKSWKGDFIDKAYDVTIQWKKAFEYGKSI